MSHVLTIIAQNGGSVPYTRKENSLWPGEEFQELDNGKEEKTDATGRVVKGITKYGVIWASIEGSGRFIGKYSKISHIKTVVEMINGAFDDEEEYFVMPTQTELKQIIKDTKGDVPAYFRN